MSEVNDVIVEVDNTDNDNEKKDGNDKRGFFTSKFATYMGVQLEEDTEVAPQLSYFGKIIVTVN